jgi:hypothetical protein
VTKQYAALVNSTRDVITLNFEWKKIEHDEGRL